MENDGAADYKLLCDTLRDVVANAKEDELIMITKDVEGPSLEYGIMGREPTRVKFANVDEDNFWEFVYTGIIDSVNPNPAANFTMIRGLSEVPHMAATIIINENVQAFVTNINHRYDGWLEQLKEKYEQGGREVQYEKRNTSLNCSFIRGWLI